MNTIPYDPQAAIKALIVSEEEIRALTGAKWPSRQLKILLDGGFFRARIVDGRVLLERAHYQAVCESTASRRPKVRPCREAA